MNEKLMQQKTVSIGDKSYVLQMVPATWYLDTVDSCKDENGNMMSGKYMAAILAHVVASPRCTIDDFTGGIYTLRNLVKEAEKFILGEELQVKEDTQKNAMPLGENVSVENGSSGA